jgi:hypothetical protein
MISRWPSGKITLPALRLAFFAELFQLLPLFVGATGNRNIQFGAKLLF